jgi:hypothetical protein
MDQSDEVRVLLIEDDGTLAQMYRTKLERDGYTARRPCGRSRCSCPT